jgi:hypothetical protein
LWIGGSAGFRCRGRRTLQSHIWTHLQGHRPTTGTHTNPLRVTSHCWRARSRRRLHSTASGKIECVEWYGSRATSDQWELTLHLNNDANPAAPDVNPALTGGFKIFVQSAGVDPDGMESSCTGQLSRIRCGLSKRISNTGSVRPTLMTTGLGQRAMASRRWVTRTSGPSSPSAPTLARMAAPLRSVESSHRYQLRFRDLRARTGFGSAAELGPRGVGPHPSAARDVGVGPAHTARAS